MDYEELESCGDLTAGDKVWICDYRHSDILEKPIRHVEPREVVIVSNSELPKGKRVYYSDIHFRPIGKKGQVLKQIIAPYDNTGFRSYAGVSLQIFRTEKECVEAYLEQCKEVKGEIARKKTSIEKELDEMTDGVDSLIAKFSN